MDAKELKEFFKGLTTSLADAISGSDNDGDDDEAKKAAETKAAEEKVAAEKEATEKAVAEKKAADEKAAKDKGGDGEGNDDPPELTKRIDDLEATVKELSDNTSAQREALEKTLETVEKLAGATAVRKGLVEQDPDDISSEDDLNKDAAKSRVGLENAVAAAAQGATIRLE